MKVIIGNVTIISLLLGCITLGFKLLIGAFIRLKKFNFYKNFQIINGKVEGYEITKSYLDGRRHVFYHPKIKYFVDGKEYMFILETGDDYSHKPDVGKIVKIKYNPENPEQACKSFDTDTFFPLSIGGLCIGVGCTFLFQYLLMFFE